MQISKGKEAHIMLRSRRERERERERRRNRKPEQSLLNGRYIDEVSAAAAFPPAAPALASLLPILLHKGLLKSSQMDMYETDRQTDRQRKKEKEKGFEKLPAIPFFSLD